MKKLSLLLLLICASWVLKGMSVVPDTLLVPDNLLEARFSQLDMTGVNTGILYDKGYTPVDYRNFDGSYNCIYSSDISTFHNILKGVRSSVVSSSVIVPVADSVMVHMSNHLENTGRIPVGIAVYNYNQIVPNALRDSLVAFQTVNGEPVLENLPPPPGGAYDDVYEECTFAAFSPSVNIVPATVIYDFSPFFCFTNKTITSLAFDAGDGSGFVNVNTNNPIRSLTYTSPSVKTLRLSVTLSTNEVLYAKSTVRVVTSPASSVSDDPNIFKDVASFEGEIESDGITPKANISIRYANGSYLSKQPIIVAEAFDPFSDPLTQFINDDNPLYGYGSVTIRNISAKMSADVKNNHDIIYVDWLNSTCSIQSNADVLIKVINWVNTQKPSGYKNILIGQSMGGLIARYALRRMEIEGITHDVSTYVSDDAPHLGANVPLGFMYLAQMLYEKIGFSLVKQPWLGLIGGIALLCSDFSVSDIIPYVSEVLALRNSSSIKQMVRNYVNIWHELDTEEFELFQTTLSNIGFPQGDSGQRILNLCLSKGGVNNYTTAQPLLSFYMYGGLSINIVTYWAFILKLLTGDNSFDSFLKPTCDIVHVEVKPFLNPGSEVLRVTETYRKDFSWGASWTFPIDFDYCKHAPHSNIPKDDVNSSYYKLKNLLKGLEDPSFNNYHIACFGVGATSQERISFLPTVSSLCYNTTDYNYDFASLGVNMEQTPFDGYRFHDADKASYHLADTLDSFDFICAMDGIQVLDSTITSTGNIKYYLNKPGLSVTWSSSNPSVATINSTTGVLTPCGLGTSTVSADISYNGGHVRLNRTFTRNPPATITFPTYTLSARDMTPPQDYTNDSYRIDAMEQLSGAHIPDSLMSFVKYCWGRKMYGSSTITWNEGTSLRYNVTLPLYEDHIFYFRVRYRNTYSTTYSIRCLSLPRMIPVDPRGNLYTEDMDEVIVQLKGGAIGESVTFYCMGIEAVFDHEPTLAELCRRLLDYDVFMTEVKKLKPWGDEDTVIIPYSYRVGDSVESVQEVMVFQYNTDIQ